jgi:hypothetical protein
VSKLECNLGDDRPAVKRGCVEVFLPVQLSKWLNGRMTAKSLLGSIAFSGTVLGAVMALGWFALFLAVSRIYQVDEAENLYVASVLASGAAVPGTDLFQAMLSWLIPFASSSADLFSSARLLMVIVFWLNWILMAAATGERLFSRRWLVALVGAATLAPLWDYGFETRHDNVLLTGILLIWCMVRFRPPTLITWAFIGAAVMALEFLAMKSFVYTVPICLISLVFPPPGQKQPRWKVILATSVGAGAGFLIVRWLYHLAGHHGNYLAGVELVATVPGTSLRFWPWKVTLSRLLAQTPLLLVLVVSAVVTFLADLVRRKRAALNWGGFLPELVLFGIALVALFINPNPYPYNLLHLVPYGFLLAYRHAATLWQVITDRPMLIPTAGAAVLFVHLVPFGLATMRHLAWTNTRQEQLMNLAEKLTDPRSDPVYDAIGMVPTRPVPARRAFLHGQGLKRLVNGPGPQVRDMLAANPPAVVIPNYRIDWLPEADHVYIREHYVELADDFWVLGTKLPAGGGTFQVIHSGRYRISTLQGSDLAGSYAEGLAGLFEPVQLGTISGTLDGVPLSNRPVELTPGTHRIETAADCQPAVVWVGPRADRLHRLGAGDRTRLFKNWY